MGAMRNAEEVHALADHATSSGGCRARTADLVLTLVPPHRTMGPLTDWMIEPIYCGAFHQSTNICTFCPGREYMTMNFVVEERHLGQHRAVEAAYRTAGSCLNGGSLPKAQCERC